MAHDILSNLACTYCCVCNIVDPVEGEPCKGAGPSYADLQLQLATVTKVSQQYVDDLSAARRRVEELNASIVGQTDRALIILDHFHVVCAEKHALQAQVDVMTKELEFDDLPWTEAMRVKRDKNGHGMLSKKDIGILTRIARNRYRKAQKLTHQLASLHARFQAVEDKCNEQSLTVSNDTARFIATTKRAIEIAGGGTSLETALERLAALQSKGEGT